MPIYQDIEIEGTAYFWAATNTTAGTGADADSGNFNFDVRIGGDAAAAAPVLSTIGTLLSHADYPAGCYEIAVPCTAGNGFTAGYTYGVFGTLLIDSQNPTGFLGGIKVMPTGDSLHSAAARLMDISNATEIQADVAKVSTDATAANNLEAMLDGTGGTTLTTDIQGTLTTCTANTDMRGTDNAALAASYTATRAGYLDNLSAGAVALASGVNMTQVSGDSGAADALETMLDGTGGNVLTLSQLRIDSAAAGGAVDIDNSNGPAISAVAAGLNNPGATVTGSGAGAGIKATGGETGDGMELHGGATSGAGMTAQANGTDDAVTFTAATTGHGLRVVGAGVGSGLRAIGGETGNGLHGQGGITSGDGIYAEAQTDGDGIDAVAAGSGVDIRADITGDISGTLSTCSNLSSSERTAIVAAWAARTPGDDEDAAGHASYAQAMALLGAAHKVTVTDNGDGTATLVLYKTDGTTQFGSNLTLTTASSGSVFTGANDTA